MVFLASTLIGDTVGPLVMSFEMVMTASNALTLSSSRYRSTELGDGMHHGQERRGSTLLRHRSRRGNTACRMPGFSGFGVVFSVTYQLPNSCSGYALLAAQSIVVTVKVVLVVPDHVDRTIHIVGTVA